MKIQVQISWVGQSTKSEVCAFYPILSKFWKSCCIVSSAMYVHRLGWEQQPCSKHHVKATSRSLGTFAVTYIVIDRPGNGWWLISGDRTSADDTDFHSFDRVLIRSAHIFLIAIAHPKRDQSSNRFGFSFLVVKGTGAANCLSFLLEALRWIG